MKAATEKARGFGMTFCLRLRSRFARDRDLVIRDRPRSVAARNCGDYVSLLRSIFYGSVQKREWIPMNSSLESDFDSYGDAADASATMRSAVAVGAAAANRADRRGQLLELRWPMKDFARGVRIAFEIGVVAGERVGIEPIPFVFGRIWRCEIPKADFPPRLAARARLCKMLNLREKIVRKWRGWGVIRALDRAIRICVFFAQHSVEKCSGKLWEWRFVIAPPTPFVNLLDATEGGIPVCRAFRVDGSH